MPSFRAFLNSPVGPKTTHFWGPVANFGFVAAVCNPKFQLQYHSPSLDDFLIFAFFMFFSACGVICNLKSVINQSQGLADVKKPADMISGRMTGG